LILGPSSSRLIKTSSLFVQQIEVTNNYITTNNDDIHLYAFNEKPELSSQINWTTSKFLVVEAYTRKVTNISFYFSQFYSKECCVKAYENIDFIYFLFIGSFFVVK
jgi:hypothetical protein